MPGDVMVSIRQEADYRFANQFADGAPMVYVDEAPPFGPSPTQLLGAAIGNCLTASLLFALRKYHLDAEPLSAEVDVSVGRNADNRYRVARMTVRLKLGAPAAGLAHLQRVLDQFEEFCTVTQSVRQGIPVDVEV